MSFYDDLHVDKKTVNDIGIVSADGVVDLQSMKPMREAVRGLITDGVKHMVLDLRKVSYMDSAGISVIVSAIRGVSERKGELYVVLSAGEVERALALIQMERVVRFAPTPEEALTHLAAASAG
jgi:anti-anti-sigma factor